MPSREPLWSGRGLVMFVPVHDFLRVPFLDPGLRMWLLRASRKKKVDDPVIPEWVPEVNGSARPGLPWVGTLNIPHLMFFC